ncbi:lysosomal Pro-X carboxypeptidase isoform X2 [Myxocyprinus asiaticus]|uniref:lysosomal Pro-X carboxypeptidase isoform X2 n=1 Tax=Myxocyprinus asiaticus TaxID=70543 RepID=UPI0022215D28|nr:lysosomal Pro-X carboxypeptidase isoform X2 [Myxocyprinus asiaticus]
MRLTCTAPFFLLISCHALALKQQLLGRHAEKTSDHRSVSYKTFYFDQQIDHFGFLENGTFKQRYLLNDQHWHKEGGPILFYTGNEGDITWFCNNTGFMWDVAEQLEAMLVFAEHRYYGESMPFGEESYSNAKYLNYLTSEQALADFAVLIKALKKTLPGAQKSSVIAIGGSYGGMLAAWLRMKYPSAVIGALAASAPILQFIVPCGDFYKVVTHDFTISGADCSSNIRRSWAAFDNVSATVEGLQWLSQEFGLCAPLKTLEEVYGFKAWLQETWVNLAMVDYPYEASFLQPLPAWPVKVEPARDQRFHGNCDRSRGDADHSNDLLTRYHLLHSDFALPTYSLCVTSLFARLLLTVMLTVLSCVVGACSCVCWLALCRGAVTFLFAVALTSSVPSSCGGGFLGLCPRFGDYIIWALLRTTPASTVSLQIVPDFHKAHTYHMNTPFTSPLWLAGFQPSAACARCALS